VSAVIRPVSIETVRPIRHRVLRAGKPYETTWFPGDDAPSTVHLGVFADRALAGIASLYEQGHEHESAAGVWQLRGMAVLPDYRGRGYGKQLVAACVEEVLRKGGLRLWCNAREHTRDFYTRYGFVQEGALFEIPGVGPHYRMILNLWNEQR